MKKQDLVAGASLGLLLGALVGMSASEVVASVVAAVAALGVGWVCCVHPQAKQTGTGQSTLLTGTFTVFALTCVVSALGGVYIRTHGILSPGLKPAVSEFEEIGYSTEDATRLVAMREVFSSGGGPGVEDSVFFSTKAQYHSGGMSLLPQDANPHGYTDAPRLLENWHVRGGAWDSLAKELKGMEPDRQLSLARAAWNLVEASR